MKRTPSPSFLLSLFLLFHSWLSLAAQEVEYNAYTYDPAGRLIAVNYGKGQGISYVYDNRGNLLQRNIVAFPNLEGDPMDDDWEIFYFGDTDRDGSGDFDKDGVSDLEEFLADTDPTAANSFLRILKSTLAGGGVTIEWSSSPRLRYQLQYKEDLNDVAWFNLGGEVVADGPTASQEDPDAESAAPRFYRVFLLTEE